MTTAHSSNSDHPPNDEIQSAGGPSGTVIRVGCDIGISDFRQGAFFSKTMYSHTQHWAIYALPVVRPRFGKEEKVEFRPHQRPTTSNV